MNNEHRKEIRSKTLIGKMKDTFTTTEAALKNITKDHTETLKALEDSTNHNRELKKTKDTFRKKRKRAHARIALAVKNSTKKATTHRIQDHGAISERCREMVRELVQCGVSVERVDDVVHIVCGAFDVEVPDGISARSVSRIVLEGYVASKSAVS